MAVHEVALGLDFLNTTLSNDASLTSLAPGGVFRAYAPPSTLAPYIIIALQSGTDIITMNAFRLFSNALYQVKVIGPSSETDTLVQAASEIDSLLGLTSGTVTNGHILYCYRESPLQVDELVNGVQWSNIGGTYRLAIQQG